MLRKQHIYSTRRNQKNPELIYKKLCIYSYMFKLQSPSKYSPLDAIHPSRQFFHCSKHFLNSILMPFSASVILLFHLFHMDKTFPFEEFVHSGEQKKSYLELSWENREDGPQGSYHFWSKSAEYSARRGQAHSQVTHHEMDKCFEGIFKKNH